MLSTKTGVPDTPEVIDLDLVLSGATAKQARSPKRPYRKLELLVLEA